MGYKNVKKGYLKNEKTGVVKQFLYNPANFSDDVSVSFGELNSPGGHYPLFQYIGGDARGISLNVYLQGKPTQVKDFLNFMEEFLPLKYKKKFSKPPLVIMAMGSYVQKCIIEKYSRNFIRFDNNLEPTEVELTINMKVVM